MDQVHAPREIVASILHDPTVPQKYVDLLATTDPELALAFVESNALDLLPKTAIRSAVDMFQDFSNADIAHAVWRRSPEDYLPLRMAGEIGLGMARVTVTDPRIRRPDGIRRVVRVPYDTMSLFSRTRTRTETLRRAKHALEDADKRYVSCVDHAVNMDMDTIRLRALAVMIGKSMRERVRGIRDAGLPIRSPPALDTIFHRPFETSRDKKRRRKRDVSFNDVLHMSDKDLRALMTSHFFSCAPEK